MPRTFRKTGSVQSLARFEAEAAGLEAIRGTGTLRVPEVVGVGIDGHQSYIEMEYLELGSRSARCDATLGNQLAAMHATTADRYGWDRDNTIGATPQSNTWHTSWTSFYADERLGPQLALLAQQHRAGDLIRLGKLLLARLPDLLADHHPAPALQHGDLWSGNAGAVAGEPVVFDPACYFGDREADLAMTRLFGGFSSAFYTAYENTWPLPDGHAARLPLYQLYHVLNHANLFGGGYVMQSVDLLQRLLR